MTKMTDAELCALIDRESRNSIGVDDYFAADRRKAMEFYLGEAKGELSPPEVQGRSRVVSKDLMDTVEWAMPGIMEALSGADDIVSFKAKRQGDEKAAEDATKYANHIVYEENDGFVTLHDAVKSCLIARMGVIKVYCDKSSVEKEERYKGVSQAELEALQSDPDVEVVEVVPYGELPPAGLMEGMPPEMGQAFEVLVKRSEEEEKYVCVGVPPEEIRIAKDCRTIDDVRYIAHEVQRTASDLISEGWPRKEVDLIPSYSTPEGQTERNDRHDYDGSWDYDQNEGDKSQRKIQVTEAYVRCDYDGDGKAEYRRIVKAGTYVHENEVTDDHPFALFTPILMPYKVIGIGFYDLVEDLQRIRTVLIRQGLDNAYLANMPQRAVVEGQVNLDDLLNPRPGGIVRVKSLEAMRVDATPFIGGQVLEMMSHFGQTRDERTGVTETNSALNAESLSKGQMGSEGVQSMMQAGAQRQRLIARVLAETGIKRLYKLVLKVVTQYQDRPSQIEVNGEWLQVDPREWKNGFRLRVKVGVGSVERQQDVQNLMLIGQAQEKLAPLGLVKPQNMYETATSLAKAMGYRDPERFFSPPDPNPQPQQPPIELQLEQMKQQGAQQLAQLKSQTDMQMAQAKGQIDVHVAQMQQQAQAQQQQLETELEAQRNQAQMQNDMALEQFKVEKQTELELLKAQIAQETAIETARISAEAAVISAANKPEPKNDR